jgi:hypothetical protein
LNDNQGLQRAGGIRLAPGNGPVVVGNSLRGFMGHPAIRNESALSVVVGNYASNNRTSYSTNHSGNTVEGNLFVGEDHLAGSVSFDPPLLEPGGAAVAVVPVAGAILGDFAVASFSLDARGVTVSAAVTAPDVVSVTLHNHLRAPLDLAAGTIRAKVLKR